MKTWLLTVLLVASIIATTSKECFDPCFCETSIELWCYGRDLTQPPSGYFPEIVIANLNNNKIAVLHKYALTGFPMVNKMQIQNNLLTELDFDVLTPLTTIQYLNLEHNNIKSLTASSGVRLKRLEDIHLAENNLISLDPDVFLAAPNLKRLFLSDNPIVVSNGQPILNHPSIRILEMVGTRLGALGERSFSRLPKLFMLYLTSCGITSITGAFVHNYELKSISLRSNSITELKEGTFAERKQLLLLDLKDNPLSLLETPAVDDAMATTGHIDIGDSPLACECGYENFHWWAKSKGVSISALCKDIPNRCTFTKEAKEEL